MDKNGIYQTADERVCCSECNRWIHLAEVERGRQILHSWLCDSKAQPFLPKAEAGNTIESLAGQYSKESPGSGLNGQELLREVRRGYLTASDAMNTDF